tara:strand:- start:29 stop:517 length:489 start_codon:yes stop_codon:yes gene_type:complete
VSQYAFGHALRIRPKRSVLYRFQNFFLTQNMRLKGTTDPGTKTYTFIPFGFSGVTVNRTGDGLEASLVLPNNKITRRWAIDAIEEYWIMEVDVLIVDSDDRAGSHQIVHTYTGQVTSGQWDNVSLNLQLSTILDAVGTDIPRRSLTRDLVGNLPITNSVRLQ